MDINIIDHVAITARNLQETIEFYSKLGFKEGVRNETSTQITLFLEAGQARIEVFIPKQPTSQHELGVLELGMKHLALK